MSPGQEDQLEWGPPPEVDLAKLLELTVLPNEESPWMSGRYIPEMGKHLSISPIFRGLCIVGSH